MNTLHLCKCVVKCLYNHDPPNMIDKPAIAKQLLGACLSDDDCEIVTQVKQSPIDMPEILGLDDDTAEELTLLDCQAIVEAAVAEQRRILGPPEVLTELDLEYFATNIGNEYGISGLQRVPNWVNELSENAKWAFSFVDSAAGHLVHNRREMINTVRHHDALIREYYNVTQKFRETLGV